jgi:hypothetical protein
LVERREQHRWSSYAAHRGAAEAPEWLCREEILAESGKNLAEAQARYRAFVEAGLTRVLPNPFENVVGSTILGSLVHGQLEGNAGPAKVVKRLEEGLKVSEV